MASLLKSSSVIVSSRGVFLMLADASSRVTQVEFWGSSLTGAERAEAVAGLVSRSELFVWTLVLDGTFRVDLEVYDSAPGESSRDVLVDAFSLKLPTGAAVVRSSTATVHALSVIPGAYAGGLRWDVEQESAHSRIGSAEDYPTGEGPDGVLQLWRVA
jgi:hypothetical protein